MLPILRSRHSQVLVAVLCALVLSRMPALVFAEDAISSLVKVEETEALAVATTVGIDAFVSAPAIAAPIHDSVLSDAPNHPPIEFSILRL
jgi:hypothetical protein